MPHELDELRDLVALAGVHTVARKLKCHPMTLSIVLLSPHRAAPKSVSAVLDAFRRTDPGYEKHMDQIAQASAALRECERIMTVKCT